MDKEYTKEEILNAQQYLRNCPPWMQNYILLVGCKTEESGMLEKMARVLAEYGIPSEKIMPCIMDIMMAIERSNL